MGSARPYVVAIDGRSGAGKSTFTQRLATALGACVVDGDGFFRGGVEVRSDGPRERAEACIDWRLQRSVLTSLRAGQVASYAAFDWSAFDGRLEATLTVLEPRAFILLEGVYAARPELAACVDLRVLIRVTEATRIARLTAREGSIGPWERQWHEAETWYFAELAPEGTFDLVIDGEAVG